MSGKPTKKAPYWLCTSLFASFHIFEEKLYEKSVNLLLRAITINFNVQLSYLFVTEKHRKQMPLISIPIWLFKKTKFDCFFSFIELFRCFQNYQMKMRSHDSLSSINKRLFLLAGKLYAVCGTFLWLFNGSCSVCAQIMNSDLNIYSVFLFRRNILLLLFCCVKM